ncbi:MAG TPA: CVNH domain-containing protein [Candidatus Angelobacter sp.]|nr:CVNH domain-containing protein [Candidatus Angelobacter sp.]
MRMRYVTLGAMLAALFLFHPSKARAAAMDDYPPGTYQQTCRDIGMRGDDLVARCRDVRGRWRNAALDRPDRCWGDISNNNGRLVCEINGTLPVGSYSQSCQDVRVRWNVLRARCQNRDGNWVDTSLEGFGRCNGRIENIDGQLRCAGDRDYDHDRDRDRDHDRDRDRDRDHDGDRDRGYAPNGSYSQTCRDVRADGRSLRAVCQDVRGGWVPTSLDDYGRCVGDIVNDDGRLQCTRPGGRVVPRGSYAQTCRNVYVRGDNLRAMCQSRDGRWVWSELHDWDDCRGGIVNDNGNLRCVR